HDGNLRRSMDWLQGSGYRFANLLTPSAYSHHPCSAYRGLTLSLAAQTTDIVVELAALVSEFRSKSGAPSECLATKPGVIIPPSSPSPVQSRCLSPAIGTSSRSPAPPERSPCRDVLRPEPELGRGRASLSSAALARRPLASPFRPHPCRSRWL